jgi:hypothetical protein
MWCDQCQQDVPGIGSADGGSYCCPRCSTALHAEKLGPDADGLHSHQQRDSASQSYDGWELDQRLRHIELVLRIGAAGRNQVQPTDTQQPDRLDPCHAGPSAWHVSTPGKSTRRPKPEAASSPDALAALTWTALSLGTMALVCGGTLLGWSIVAGRAELWTIGMPVALCGQVALLIGLVLQLNGLWCDGRQAVAKLDHVDEQLHELKTATTQLGNTQNSPTSAFYSHLADGAGPQLLLTDLKSQLDLLALKISMNDE